MSDDPNDPERLRWDAERVARARAGDRAAFAELYRAYAPAVFARVLLPKLGNREAAEDALGETFRTAFERLDGYEARNVSLYFWLARIATNKALDMHRARATTGRALASFENLVAPLGETPPDPAELFELRGDTVRVQKAVRDVLERLNPRYRRAIELRFVEDLGREECATALDVKLGTFDVLILRALRAFRKEWASVVGEEPPSDAG
ncbi:MAG TPA: sigma-70 family RNA polymerase sigma factor [Polyangiaceae bacterium]|nr:sigma-70 family RNA polymerase sigma factor [Polyangiaceae bacterium]